MKISLKKPPISKISKTVVIIAEWLNKMQINLKKTPISKISKTRVIIAEQPNMGVPSLYFYFSLSRCISKSPIQ